MIDKDNINKKALHELVLYYFDEIEHGNKELKQLVISNGLDFYIFDVENYILLFTNFIITNLIFLVLLSFLL